MSTPPVIGVILAGGAGQRLGGVDKGLQLLAGRPMIEHVTEALRTQVDDLLIVANRHPDTYARFAAVIADEQPGYAGPLAGIAAAMAHAQARQMLCVPVDCPQPPTRLCARLQQALEEHPDARCAVVFDGTRRQPLFALYRAGLVESVSHALRDNSAVWHWQQGLGAIEVDFTDCAAAFRNLNTPEAFERYEHDHGYAAD